PGRADGGCSDAGPGAVAGIGQRAVALRGGGRSPRSRRRARLFPGRTAAGGRGEGSARDPPLGRGGGQGARKPLGRPRAPAAAGTVAYVWDVTGPAAAERLDEKVLDGLWSDLHSPESVRAFRAVCRLAGDPERSVPFLRQRLLYPPEEARRIARLIAGLDDQAARLPPA